MARTGGISPQIAGAVTSNATTTSIAEEAENTILVGNNRTCSNEESRKNRCSNGMPLAEGRGYTKESLCYRHG